MKDGLELSENFQKEDVDLVFKASDQKDSIQVDDSGLTDLNARKTFTEYVKDIHNRRDFIVAKAKSKALSSGRDLFLGKFWLVLQPLLEVLLYILIFGIILNTSHGIDNFPGFLVIGVTVFRCFSRGIVQSSSLLQSSKALISSFQFPRATLAISATLRQSIDNLIPVILALVIAIGLQINSRMPTVALLLLIPLYFAMHIFILSLTLIIGRITALVPDARSLVGLVNRGLFFLSGVFYSLDRFDGHPLLHRIMTTNPIYQYLEAFRSIALRGALPSLESVTIILLSITVLPIIGLFYFWRAENKYAAVL